MKLRLFLTLALFVPALVSAEDSGQTLRSAHSCDAARFGVEVGDEVPRTTQERAYTSPIWYTP